MSVPVVKQAMQEGYTFTCATCVKLHKARAKGLDGCMAVHEKKSCVGPFGEGWYPEYEGPLKGNLVKYCFVCGADSDGAVGIQGPTRNQLHLVGVCEEHMPRLEDVTPKGANPPRFVTHEDAPVIKS